MEDAVQHAEPEDGKQRLHPKAKFSPDEDEMLRNLVQIYGEEKWTEVAQNISGRNVRQCRERWKNYLDPKKEKGKWTEEEDILLRQKCIEYGHRWTRIAQFFPQRTDINVKNRWLLIERHKAKAGRFSKPPKGNQMQKMGAMEANKSFQPTASGACIFDATDHDLAEDFGLAESDESFSSAVNSADALDATWF